MLLRSSWSLVSYTLQLGPTFQVSLALAKVPGRGQMSWANTVFPRKQDLTGK